MKRLGLDDSSSADISHLLEKVCPAGERGAVIRGSVGTETWISLGLGGGAPGDWDDSGNRSVPQRLRFGGVANIQQPCLADVNSSTVTELLCNPKYE